MSDLLSSRQLSALPTAELLGSLEQQGFILSIDGDHLRIRAPKGSIDEELHNLLISRKEELRQYLQEAAASSDSAEIVDLLASSRMECCSFAQQRMWMINQMEPELAVYHVTNNYRLVGDLNLAALEESFREIVRRHETLRTIYQLKDGEPWQIILKDPDITLPLIDLTHLPENEREAAALRLVGETEEKPFDLSVDLSLRIGLLRLAARNHILMITTHHIATDGWSQDIFWQELTELYAAQANGRSANLPPLPLQYADFARRQREQLQGPALAKLVDYWRGQLADVEPLNLLADYPRPAVQTYQGEREVFELPEALVQKLRNRALQAGVTPYMIFLTAFNVLLYRYTGQEDITIGSPVANRNQRDIERLIGFFVNTIVLRTGLSGNPPFSDLLRRTREAVLYALQYQDLPFEKLVEELETDRQYGRTPLFQAYFTFQKGSQLSQLQGLAVEELPSLAKGTSKFELSLYLIYGDDGITGTVEYRSDLYKMATIRGLIDHFLILLAGIAEDVNRPINQLPLISAQERRQILVDANDTRREYPRDLNVHQLFEDQVKRTPDATAVVYNEQTLSYRLLNERANQLARFLRQRGVVLEDRVGIFMPRSPDMLVAILGILKAGGSYLPLDLNFPQQRLAFMCVDAGITTLLTQEDLQQELGALQAEKICLDAERPDIATYDTADLSAVSAPDNLAYIMYTSGSTGRPKGTEIGHRSIVRLLFGIDYVDLTHQPTILQLAPTSFDASTFEIWGALLHGGKVVLAPDGMLDFQRLDELIYQTGVDTIWLTASLFNQIIDYHPQLLRGIKQLLTGGEALSVKHVLQAFDYLPEDGRLVNGYGPTESTTFACCFPIPRTISREVTSIPIGRPIGNTQVYVLDNYQQLVPIGVPGELYIGGDGLARAYVNRPELTASKFVETPVVPGQRLYRTGDIVRWLPEGILEFLGRNDHQVKIRGYRIELGEIESHLDRHPAIKQSLVITHKRAGGEMALIAYYVPQAAAELPPSELSQYIRDRLPDFMVPARFVPLPAFPLTPSGKMDLKALPSWQELAEDPAETRQTPATPEEERLLAVWREVLDRETIGVNESFFDLGGHSLLGVRLFARIEAEFGKRLPFELLFRAPTVAQLAPHLREDAAVEKWPTLVPIYEGGDRTPFFCVHGFGGGVLGYSDLARLLGEDQPFYGLKAAGDDGISDPDTTIESMAARYITAIKELSPEGPYLLGGYCLGGVVAFEMARQLEENGDNVGLVAIMEGYAPVRYHKQSKALSWQRWLTVWRNVPYWLEDYWGMGKNELKIRIAVKSKQWWRQLTHQGKAQGPAQPEEILREDIEKVPEYHRRLMEAQILAIRNYNPRPFGGGVTLYVAQGKTISRALFGSGDPEHGWGELARGGVEIRVVDGGHRNIHQPPHVASLAGALQKSLRAIANAA